MELLARNQEPQHCGFSNHSSDSKSDFFLLSFVSAVQLQSGNKALFLFAHMSTFAHEATRSTFKKPTRSTFNKLKLEYGRIGGRFWKQRIQEAALVDSLFSTTNQATCLVKQSFLGARIPNCLFFHLVTHWCPRNVKCCQGLVIGI